jgi:capsular exopolysaccharide synthesis family protein
LDQKANLSTPAVVRAHVDAAREQFDVRALLGLLRRQLGAVVGTIVVVTCLVLLAATQLDPRYTASALVVVDQREAQLLGFDSVAPDATALGQTVDTEVEVARSSAVLVRALDQSDLSRFPILTEKGLLDLFGASAADTTARNWKALSETEQSRYVERLADITTVSRRNLTRVIEISATGMSPQEGAHLANVVAQAYVDEQLSAKLVANQRAADLMRQRVAAAALEMRQLETRIDNFVLSAFDQIGSPEVKERVSGMRAELARSVRLRGEMLSQMRTLESAITSNRADLILQSLGGNDATELTSVRDAFVQRLAELSPDDAPNAEELRAELASLDEEIKNSARHRMGELQSQLDGAETSASRLRSELQKTLTGQDLPSGVMIELYELQRDSEARRLLFDASISRLRQVEEQATFTSSDSRIIAEARPPSEPSFPPTRLLLASGLLLSVGMGLGIGFLREHYIGGYTSPDQLEASLGIPVVSVLAKVRRSTVDRQVIDAPFSPFAEAIRRIKVSIEGSVRHKPMKVAITSTAPDEGKTTIALAYARACALAGNKTVLVDADFRNPRLHRRVGVTPAAGVSKLLAQAGSPPVEIETIRERSTGLRLVLGASPSELPSDALLASQNFNRLLGALEREFDVIVLDTAPAGLTVDAEILAEQIDVMVFVVKWAKTSQQHVLRTIQRLRRQSQPLIYIALNQASMSLADGHYMGYSYDRREH